MKITIISLFPDMFSGFLNDSIIKRAQDKGIVEIKIVQLRDFAVDEYGTVDDRPYGGGAGMVLMAEPIINAIQSVATEQSYAVLTSPRGTVFNQEKAHMLSKKDELILIAGHYEGTDERVAEHIDEEISIGDYVLTGGELPAATIIDAVVRLLPGVLKKDDAAANESFFTVSLSDVINSVGNDTLLQQLQKEGVEEVTLLEYPHYTRPQEFLGKKVPNVLLNGNHADITSWKIKKAFKITKEKRPDLLK